MGIYPMEKDSVIRIYRAFGPLFKIKAASKHSM